MDIIVCNGQDKIKVKDELIELLEEVGRYALVNIGSKGNYEVSVLLTDNNEIRSLNYNYRNIDRETDVLSFAQIEENPDSKEPLYLDDSEVILLGDVVISMEKALEQSEDFGHSFEREISYLLVHGILHLLGYDHETKEEKEEMRQKEESILVNLNQERTI